MKKEEAIEKYKKVLHESSWMDLRPVENGFEIERTSNSNGWIFKLKKFDDLDKLEAARNYNECNPILIFTMNTNKIKISIPGMSTAKSTIFWELTISEYDELLSMSLELNNKLFDERKNKQNEEIFSFLRNI